LALLALAAAHAGGIHRWTDSAGNVHFGDRPPVAVASDDVELRINTYHAPDTRALEEVFQVDDRVVMYSASWCGVCKQARQYFRTGRIPFREYDIETSPKGRRDYRRLGARGVPVILVGKQRLDGFNPASFERIYRR
jgi:glutaredoxin